MFHYLIRVPSDNVALISEDAVIARLESYNGSSAYLLFDSGDAAEKRFVMVSEEKLSEDGLSKLRGIFEQDVKAEELRAEHIDGKLLQKFCTAKDLMAGRDNYNGKKKSLFTTESCSQLLEKADAMPGFAAFHTFLEEFSLYIDRTADMSANAMYNVVFVNQCETELNPCIELLCRFFAAGGLLAEQVMIKGTIYDAQHTAKETQCAYVIEDEWKTDDSQNQSDFSPEDRLLVAIFGGDDINEHSSTLDKTRLFEKILHSRNVYITSMSQEDYAEVSGLDSFAAAFPHVVMIGDPPTDDKLKSICSIAGEYGFSVNTNNFADSVLMDGASMEDIEIALRKSIQQKLIAGDTSVRVDIADLKIKPVRPQRAPAFDELESLIGLDSVKKTIHEIAALLKKRGKSAVPCLHMAFLGNPGTGKTTVARIIARIFAEEGIIEKDLLVETQRGGLIGIYLGQTAPKTARVIESAMGGVFFIDEAYALVERDDDMYGHEAVSTLVKIMEDKRDKFVCILAGYPKEMNEMLDTNPGLRDRIQFYIDFPDYSGAELLQVFEKLCKDHRYTLSNSARAALASYLKQILGVKSANFSNGRLVRKIFERVRIKQALRASNNTITRSDIERTFAERDIAAFLGNNRAMIGFQRSA